MFFAFFFTRSYPTPKQNKKPWATTPKQNTRLPGTYLGGYAQQNAQDYTAPLTWHSTINKYRYLVHRNKEKSSSDHRLFREVDHKAFVFRSQSTKTCLSTRSNPPLAVFCFLFSSLLGPHVFPPMISAEVKAAVTAMTARDKAVDSRR